ncbi:hypothetical protein V5O48_015653 [Marasmius crinis-equi]|uniref:Uncharacterized protein n=1 Tax=Marasmius crinis-equi TaxID=585013 RepID=A0ABR3ETZ0_9AGAR
MATPAYLPESMNTPLLNSRVEALYPHLEAIIKNMKKSALTNVELGKDFVKRLDRRGRNYGFADNAGRVFSTNVFGEIVGTNHGTSLGATGTHYWGSDPSKPVPITDHTKVKHQIVIGVPSFAPQSIVDDFADQIVFYYVKLILRHSVPNATDKDDPDLITLTLGQVYTVLKEDDNASKGNKGKGKDKESTQRKMKKRKAAEVEDNHVEPTPDIDLPREPSLLRPLADHELPSPARVRVGAEYPPNVFADYGGPLFQQRIARARQPDICAEDNTVIPIFKSWDQLRVGTLIMANINIVVWVIVSKNKQGKEEKKKIYHVIVKSLRVLGKSDVPVTKPAPNLTDVPPVHGAEEVHDNAANTLTSPVLPSLPTAPLQPGPSSSASTIFDSHKEDDYNMNFEGEEATDSLEDGGPVDEDIEPPVMTAGPSKKAKKSRR